MVAALEREPCYAAEDGLESGSPHFVFVNSTPCSYSRFVGIEFTVAFLRKRHRDSGKANMSWKAGGSNTLVRADRM